MSISQVSNLALQIEKRLPRWLAVFLDFAGEMARGESLYLVGGVVRDLLLERINLDIDLVLEGDALELARCVAPATSAKLTEHPRFGTATLQWKYYRVDIAGARKETYATPGALPAVKPGAIEEDLFRRDFTINAMAAVLNIERYGEIIDLYGGRRDLEKRLIRVLHKKSFTDDATRIWRAIRYEQRLDFHIEPETLALLRRDVPMLDAISGDRIRHELELVLKEEFPENALRRADELGVLAKVNPALSGDKWLAEVFEEARKMTAPERPSVLLYLALLCYRMPRRDIEKLIEFLRLTKAASDTVREVIHLRGKLEELSSKALPNSRIHALLEDCNQTVITAGIITTDRRPVKERLQLYLDKLRYVRTALNGNDLKKMGIASGKQMGEILHRLLEAKLDGKVTTRKEEEAMVREWGKD